MKTNREIARMFRQARVLMELEGENPFKVKAYDKAADALETYPGQVMVDIEAGKPPAVEGIGSAMLGHLKEIAQSGSFKRLEELRQRIPAGVVEMSQLRGLGPKKLLQLWKEQEITSVEALMTACETGRIAKLKGFGEKTQAALYNSAMYRQAQQGLLHLDAATERAETVVELLQKLPGTQEAAIVGQVRRALPVVECVEWLAISALKPEALVAEMASRGLQAYLGNGGAHITLEFERGETGKVHLTTRQEWAEQLFRRSSGEGHITALEPYVKGATSEAEIYARAGQPYLPAELREDVDTLKRYREKAPLLLEVSDLKGSLHAHSTWSDGAETIERMAEACRERGLQYLGLTDHSRTAAYAGGLSIERVEQQWIEIDNLNQKWKDFQVLKGIESDILVDGQLDYPAEILTGFDFVIASIHSGFQMDEARATQRLIRAVENPYTNILGHPTGRLLLAREGYPINHAKVIDACAATGTAIEINANPYRLDLDWQWVAYALDKGVHIAISPDAHAIGELDYARWGVAIGRKGGLTPEQTLNCFTADELLKWFRGKRG